jgi:succinoglycan biosynthesis protein ExoA
VTLPFVTVVMPVRNEAGFIERSLGAVLAQDYPSDRFEVVVVDGMSDDVTPKIVRQIAEEARRGNGPAVRLLENPKRIVPTALNEAIRHANGDIVVRVDGHCEIQPDYVARCVELFDRTQADCVGGLMRAHGDGTVGRAIALATSSPFGVGNSRFHYTTRPGWSDSVYLGAYRRDVFDRVGMFDEELMRNQDDEFNYRLVGAGGRIWLDPSIQTSYEVRPSLGTLFEQYRQYGTFKVRVIQKRGVTSWRHLVPPAFVGALGAGALASVITRRPLWLAALGGTYAIVALGAGMLSGSRDAKVLLALPVAFGTIHLAYGIGFWQGLWRFGSCSRSRRRSSRQTMPTRVDLP